MYMLTIQLQHSGDALTSQCEFTRDRDRGMAAYLIVDVSAIEDPQTYAQYRALVSPGLIQAGGEYLARGGAIDVLEGEWTPQRIVVVRFPSADAARLWWNSAAYSELKRMRQASAHTNMILVEGVEGGNLP